MTSTRPEIIDLTNDSPGPSSSKLAVYVNGSRESELDRSHNNNSSSPTRKPPVIVGAKLGSVIVISDDDSPANDRLYPKNLYLSETLTLDSLARKSQVTSGRGQPLSSERKKKKKRGKDDRKQGKSRDSSTNGETSGLFFLDDQPAVLPSTDPIPDVSDATNISLNADDPANTSGLLLPEHVILTLVPNGSGGELSMQDDSTLEEDDFIRYLDYDDDTQRGVARYFDPGNDKAKSRLTCKHCGAEGDHKTSECPVLICLTCGARDEHSTRQCPISKTCFSCGLKGHINRDCPNRSSGRYLRHADCDRCGSTTHSEKECPTLWRLYEYVSDAEQINILASRRDKEHLLLGEGGEGYIREDIWCYSCGEDGHLGDDCRAVKRPSDFPQDPSAFSLYNTMSGPFADQESESRRSGKRRRPREWEENGNFDDGYGFSGPSDVGRRGRDKERERLRKREREVQQEGSDDDWFGQRKNDSQHRPPPLGPRHKNGNSQSTNGESRSAGISIKGPPSGAGSLLDRIRMDDEDSTKKSHGRKRETSREREKHRDRDRRDRDRSKERRKDRERDRGRSEGDYSRAEEKHNKDSRRHYYGGYR